MLWERCTLHCISQGGSVLFLPQCPIAVWRLWSWPWTLEKVMISWCCSSSLLFYYMNFLLVIGIVYEQGERKCQGNNADNLGWHLFPMESKSYCPLSYPTPPSPPRGTWCPSPLCLLLPMMISMNGKPFPFRRCLPTQVSPSSRMFFYSHNYPYLTLHQHLQPSISTELGIFLHHLNSWSARTGLINLCYGLAPE